MTRCFSSSIPAQFFLLLLFEMLSMKEGSVASMSRITPMDLDSKKWVSRWSELVHPRIRPPDDAGMVSTVVSVIASLGLSVASKSPSMMCLFPSRL